MNRQYFHRSLESKPDLGTLAFDHDGGACTSHNDKIYLCFSWEGDEKLCRQASAPLESFSEMPRSNYEHTLTGMAASNSKLTKNLATVIVRPQEYPSSTSNSANLFTVGDGNYKNEHNIAEIFLPESQQWNQVASYPWHQVVGHMTVVYTSNAFYTFGGLAGFDYVKEIGRYDMASDSWSLAGHLQVSTLSKEAVVHSQPCYLRLLVTILALSSAKTTSWLSVAKPIGPALPCPLKNAAEERT